MIYLFQLTPNLEKNLLKNLFIIITNGINYTIKIFKNKGRDVLPFIIQLKKVIKNYKYMPYTHKNIQFILNLWKN